MDKYTKKNNLLDEIKELNAKGKLYDRESRLKIRQQFCEKFNKMFGLNLRYYLNDKSEKR